MSETMRIGVAGLGRMGLPMATNIARAGFPLTLWNRTGAKAEAAVHTLDAAVAATPRALAEASDIVITMIADDAASEALYLGDNGLAEAADGRLFIEMSTVSPGYIRRLGLALVKRGGALVDAPVSGSTAAAAEASLAVMAGGDPADIERARPVLEAVGRIVLPTGPLGTGATMKIVVNSLIHGLNQTLAEALAIAEGHGIATEDAFEVIENSAAAAPMLRYRKPLYLDEAANPVSFALALAGKDMGLALDLAREAGVDAPQAAVTRGLLLQATEAGFGERDMAAMVAFMRAARRADS